LNGESVDAAIGQDIHPLRHVLDVRRDIGRAIMTARVLAGSRHTRHAEVNQLVERRERIRHDFKRAVKNNLSAGGALHELPSAFSIHSPIRGKNAGCYPIGILRKRGRQIMPRHDEFARAVKKAAGARESSQSSAMRIAARD